MKRTLSNISLIAAIFIFQSAQAQLQFQDHSIDNTDCLYRLFPSDVDQDGDMDFFAICFADNFRYISWYENTDGRGDFKPTAQMSTGEEAATRLFPSDIDGDGDVDLLSASQGVGGREKKLFWYENTDGKGNFGDRQVIDISSATPWSVHAIDMDGDMDLDVVASRVKDQIIWYENTDGKGSFGDAQLIADTISAVFDTYVADLDGDGDIDVLSVSDDENEVVWYENTDGKGNFGAQNIILSGETGVQDLDIQDLDGDGDLDVLSTSRFSGASRVAWYENTDGAGTFGEQQTIRTGLSQPRSIHARDMDGDGDQDILIKTGDASSNSSVAMWFENLNLVNTQEYSLTEFSIYPTLASDFLHITSETAITSLEIYNALGQMIYSEYAPTRVDISSLNQGTYFCVVKDKNKRQGIQKIIKIE